MWTRKELKDKAKASVKMNYWKTVLIALLFAALTGTFFGAGAGAGGAAGGTAGSSYAFSFDSSTMVVETGEITDEDIDAMLEETGVDLESIEELTDPDATVEEIIESTGVQPSSEEDFPFALFAIAGAVILAVVLVAVALALVVNAFLLNPVVVGAQRFSVRNLNQPAEVKETAFAFDNNYREIVKTMFLRDIFTLAWGLLLIIPGIVKAYEYRMIPYLLADDPTMTKDRAFAESRAMMHGNKWRAFVLDLSFLGWHLLSVFTLGLLEIFYVAPYELMTDAALYESLRYGTGAPELATDYAEQIPVPPFAAAEGFAPVEPEA